jgi:hypothetical protein
LSIRLLAVAKHVFNDILPQFVTILPQIRGMIERYSLVWHCHQDKRFEQSVAV